MTETSTTRQQDQGRVARGWVPAPLPIDEAARLDVLCGLGVLDTPHDRRFDALTATAARSLRAPIALVSLVDAARQWFKSHHGVSARETPRDMAFCAHAILQDQILVIPDAHRDERFAGNPLVTGPPHMRFYAGAQLRASGGQQLGTFCVIDTVPRETFGVHERALLRDFAQMAVHLIEVEQIVGTRHHRQDAALVRIGAALAGGHEPGSPAIHTALETAARTLGVDRAAFWRCTSSGQRLVREVVHDPAEHYRNDRATLTLAEFPRYCKALEASACIATPDARTDQRTEALAERVLGAAGGMSLLHARVGDAGALRGVLSLETRTTGREWHRDEQSFAQAVSDQLTHALSRFECERAARAKSNAERARALGALCAAVGAAVGDVLDEVDGGLREADASNGPDAYTRGPLRRIGASVARGRALTRAFGELAAGSANPHAVALDLPAALDSLLPELRAVLGPEHELRLEPADTRQWQVMADPRRLGQALSHLARNAAEAMPDGGVLRVEVANTSLDDGFVLEHPGLDPGDYVMISISDSGPGLGLPDTAQAFDPVYTTKANGHGLGLGLCAVQSFAASAGGTVSLISDAELGTTVNLYLPRLLTAGLHAADAGA